MSQEAQALPQPPQIPLIVLYQQQLASFKQQRDQARSQLDQLNGAIAACEYMINVYEENAKQALAKLTQQGANALKPIENPGAINNGETNDETEKQVA